MGAALSVHLARNVLRALLRCIVLGRPVAWPAYLSPRSGREVEGVGVGGRRAAPGELGQVPSAHRLDLPWWTCCVEAAAVSASRALPRGPA